MPGGFADFCAKRAKAGPHLSLWVRALGRVPSCCLDGGCLLRLGGVQLGHSGLEHLDGLVHVGGDEEGHVAVLLHDLAVLGHLQGGGEILLKGLLDAGTDGLQLFLGGVHIGALGQLADEQGVGPDHHGGEGDELVIVGGIDTHEVLQGLGAVLHGGGHLGGVHDLPGQLGQGGAVGGGDGDEGGLAGADEHRVALQAVDDAGGQEGDAVDDGGGHVLQLLAVHFHGVVGEVDVDAVVVQGEIALVLLGVPVGEAVVGLGHHPHGHDVITLLMILTSTAVIIYFGEAIKKALSVNLLLLFVLSQGVYLGIRCYLKNRLGTKQYW